MGRAKDANGDLPAIGDHQLAKHGYRTTLPLQNAKCEMRNRKAQFRILPMISPFRIPHFAFLQVSASTGFSSIPIGAIVARIRSPGLRNVPVAEPTPDGVPVAMMSPGSSVTN